MELNEIIEIRPTVDGKPSPGKIMQEGRIVYIHPEGRFCTVEVKCQNRAFCETVLLTPAERAAYLKKKKEKLERTRQNAAPPGYFPLSECCKAPAKKKD